MRHRILILRLGAIGDVVRTIPVAEALRKEYRSAHIAWAVEPKSVDVLSGNPAIDELVVFERAPVCDGSIRQRVSGTLRNVAAFVSFVRTLRRKRFDCVLDFHGIFKSGLAGWLSGAPERIGYSRAYSKELNSLFTNRRVSPGGRRISRFEKNACLLAAVTRNPPETDATIYVPDRNKEEVDRLLAERRGAGNNKLVVVHCATSRPLKQWPTEYYARTCDTLVGQGLDVVLTCGTGEEGIRDEIRSLMNEGSIIINTPSLKHYAWLVKRADVYFGGDTGPMHIASAMGTPVVAVFGPTDPVVVGPYRQPYKVLWKKLDCSPCNERGCKRNIECMRSIPPEEATAAILELLEGTREGE